MKIREHGVTFNDLYCERYVCPQASKVITFVALRDIVDASK